jgi:hypothetical protein
MITTINVKFNINIEDETETYRNYREAAPPII